MAYIYTMTDEELVRHVWKLEEVTPLETELAQRLEALLESYEELEDIASNLSSCEQVEGVD